MASVATKIIQANGADTSVDSYIVGAEKFLVAVVVSVSGVVDFEVTLSANDQLTDLTINPPDQSIVLRAFNTSSASIGCRIPLKKGSIISLYRSAAAFVACNLCLES